LIETTKDIIKHFIDLW